MANHYTKFSTSLRVGPGNVEAALALYAQMQAELGDHDHIGFDAERDGSDDESVWLWDGGDGVADIENVIAYAFRCAAAFDLTGSWGFHWSLTCSSPRKNNFGGVAQMLHLGRRESLGWMDCEHWVAARTDADGPCREPAEKILASAADTGGWTEAKQLRALLSFIDRLTTADPTVVEQLYSYLADVSAELDEVLCRECGAPMFAAGGGTSHHVGAGMDGIDYDRDRDHAAVADSGIAGLRHTAGAGTMNVRRFLDVFSGHLSAETWIWLDAQTDADLVRASAHRHAEILGGRTRHGWFLYASEAPVAPIPADLAAIMRRARRHDCEYVLFDVDARLSKDLPVLHPGFQGTPSPA